MKVTVPAPGGQVEDGRVRVCLHLHTRPRSPDASLDPVDALCVAAAAGAALLVLTEHDASWTPAALAELRAAAGPEAARTVPLGGRELCLPDAHLLVVGALPPIAPELVGPGRIQDLVAALHRSGCAVVLAHPWDARWQIPPRMAKEWGVDAVEAAGARHREPGEEGLAALRAAGLPGVAGVDAHHPEHLGLIPACLTLVPGWVRDEASLIKAIRRGEVACPQESSSRLHRASSR